MTEKITSRDAQTGNTIQVLYAMYDAHGNMMCTAKRSGSGLVIENHRGYDAWGAIRWGAGSAGRSGHGVGGGGDPFDASVTDGSQRYVANLGHMADAESGLIYMRARYYEPSTGRFISEDPAMDGNNWFVYAASNPIHLVDRDGMVINNVEAIKSYIAAMGLPLGYTLGFYFMASFLERMNPGYKSHYLVHTRRTMSGAFGILASGIRRPFMDSVMGTGWKSRLSVVNWFKLGQSILAGMRSLGWSFASSFSIYTLLGLVYGIAAAFFEFLVSYEFQYGE